jgi:hypothetical protein
MTMGPVTWRPQGGSYFSGFHGRIGLGLRVPEHATEICRPLLRGIVVTIFSCDIVVSVSLSTA